MSSDPLNAIASHGSDKIPPVDYQAIVLGAGFSGLRVLYELRKLGLSVKVFEAGSDVGGTWYWNRYPGARTDSEAWAYCYSFSKELQDEWVWEDRMPSQSQVLSYLQHVAERFDLRKDIQFDARIRSAHFDERSNQWTLVTECGERFTCTYFVSATGLLSAVYKPPFKGLDDFEGQWYHTGRWPHEPVDFAGKRVAIIGSGSTAVQILPLAAQTARQVSLFQRTPNYVLPGRNYPLDEAHRQGIRANYDAIWKQVRNQAFAFPMDPANRTFDDVTQEERQRIFEAGWETGGFRFIFETFDDLMTDTRSNDAAADFVRNKIRSIVKDPETARLLSPTYPLAAKRPPLGNQYYEAFNRANVSLVDVANDPIEVVTRNGVRTGRGVHECEIIILATGFDAGTGALMHIDVRGRGGRAIQEKWKDGPHTNLGIMVDDFPNMFMIVGPQSAFANSPPCIENTVKWISRAISAVEAQGFRRMEPTPTAVESWAVVLRECLDATVLGREDVNSWFLGSNIPGKPPSVLFYLGGAAAYFNELQDSIDSGFQGFSFA